jgi:hypothetical protein
MPGKRNKTAAAAASHPASQPTYGAACESSSPEYEEVDAATPKPQELSDCSSSSSPVSSCEPSPVSHPARTTRHGRKIRCSSRTKTPRCAEPAAPARDLAPRHAAPMHDRRQDVAPTPVLLKQQPSPAHAAAARLQQQQQEAAHCVALVAAAAALERAEAAAAAASSCHSCPEGVLSSDASVESPSESTNTPPMGCDDQAAAAEEAEDQACTASEAMIAMTGCYEPEMCSYAAPVAECSSMFPWTMRSGFNEGLRIAIGTEECSVWDDMESSWLKTPDLMGGNTLDGAINADLDLCF